MGQGVARRKTRIGRTERTVHRQLNRPITGRDRDVRTNSSLCTRDLDREHHLQNEKDNNGKERVVPQKSDFHDALLSVEEIPQGANAENGNAGGSANLQCKAP